MATQLAEKKQVVDMVEMEGEQAALYTQAVQNMRDEVAQVWWVGLVLGSD